MIGRLAVVCLLIADGLVFATVAEALASTYSADQHAVPAWGFALVALAGYYVPRLVEQYEIGARTAYAITALTGAMLIYLFVRVAVAGDIAVWDLGWVGNFLSHTSETIEDGGHAIAAGILLLLTWGRTSYRSADEIEMETLPRTVAVPFTVVTIVVVLGAQADRSGEIARAGAAFYAFAILALACSQLALSGATFGEVRAGSTAGTLLIGVGAGAAIVLLVIALFTAVLGPVIGPVIGAAVEWVLTIVLTPFAWLLTKFFQAIFHGANPFPDLDQRALNTSREAADPHNGERSEVRRVSVFMLRILALMAMLAVVALVTTVFVRLRKRHELRAEDGRETSTAGDFRADLQGFFRSMFRRKPAPPRGYASSEATRLYLDVLRRAEADGLPREEAVTASEFAPELSGRYDPAVSSEITRAFEAARYGAHEPDPRTLGDLRRRWESAR